MMEKRDIPESIAVLIGPKKTEEAAKKASDMASKLDNTPVVRYTDARPKSVSECVCVWCVSEWLSE